MPAPITPAPTTPTRGRVVASGETADAGESLMASRVAPSLRCAPSPASCQWAARVEPPRVLAVALPNRGGNRNADQPGDRADQPREGDQNGSPVIQWGRDDRRGVRRRRGCGRRSDDAQLLTGWARGWRPGL